MLDLRHTLRRPFTIPEEPIEGLAMAIGPDDDEDEIELICGEEDPEQHNAADPDIETVDLWPVRQTLTDNVE